jgi:membrane-associated phospholipid phosphatase
LKHWRAWLVPAVAAFAFLVIWVLGANQRIFVALNALGPATSDWLWANITVLGDTVVAFALCLPLWRRRPDLLWAFLFLALLGTLWVHGLKHFFDVTRPPGVLPDIHIIGPAYKAGSFPSGHATTVFAIAGLYALGTRVRTPHSSVWVIFVTAALVAALSRSVVGVHWPLDILAGAFGGWLCAVAALALARRTMTFGGQAWVQWALGLFLAGCAVFLILGPNKSGFPQADVFQRAIGICCLAAAAARLKRAAA